MAAVAGRSSNLHVGGGDASEGSDGNGAVAGGAAAAPVTAAPAVITGSSWRTGRLDLLVAAAAVILTLINSKSIRKTGSNSPSSDDSQAPKP